MSRVGAKNERCRSRSRAHRHTRLFIEDEHKDDDKHDF